MDPSRPLFVVRYAGNGKHPRPRARRTAVSHDYATIGFYTGGQVQLEQRGRWTLHRGDVLLIPAGEPHRMVDVSGPELWGLGFCAPCFAAEDPAVIVPFERVRAGASPVVSIAPERQGFLEQLFRELAEPRVQPASAAVQRSLLTLIVDEVTAAAGWNAAAARKGDVVSESLAFIERRCLGPLTLREVAAAVGRTPSHVTASLTRVTGRSAVAWIIAGRMAEARRLLAHSDEHVDTIAERVGYADATHFIRLFRRTHGVTPAAWRAAQARTSAPR